MTLLLTESDWSALSKIKIFVQKNQYFSHFTLKPNSFQASLEKVSEAYFVRTLMDCLGPRHQVEEAVLSPANTQGHFLSVYQAGLPVSQRCGWLWLMGEEQTHLVRMYTV